MMRSWLAGILIVLCFGVVGCLSNDLDLSDGNNDCDPINPEAYGGALELCGDKIDNDCLGGDSCLPSLVGHWSFTDTTGETTIDLTGNTPPAQLMNGLTHLPSDMLLFDGEDDYVMVADAPSLSATEGTIAFWFSPSVVGDIRQSMLSKDSAGRDQGGHISFYITEAGTLQLRMQSNQNDFEIESLPILANQWYHVVMVYGGNGGIKLSLNGVEVGTNPYTGGLQTNLEPLVIGAGTDNSGNQTAEPISNPFQGIIADVQVYDRRLSGQEVADLNVTTVPAGAL